MSTFGERIAARRLEIGLTQDALAKKMGYKSRSTITKIETGVNEVSVENVPDFAKALDTTEEYLMGIEEIKKKSKVAVDLTKRLGSDKEFAEVVKRLYEDNDFFELAKMLSGRTPEQIEGVKFMLSTLFK